MEFSLKEHRFCMVETSLLNSIFKFGKPCSNIADVLVRQWYCLHHSDSVKLVALARSVPMVERHLLVLQESIYSRLVRCMLASGLLSNSHCLDWCCLCQAVIRTYQRISRHPKQIEHQETCRTRCSVWKKAEACWHDTSFWHFFCSAKSIDIAKNSLLCIWREQTADYMISFSLTWKFPCISCTP